MRRALDGYAERVQEPMGLDVLCRFAEIRWPESAIAVSVPIGVVGAPRAQTYAVSDLARDGEELQATLGEGPSLDVLAGAGAIDVDEFGKSNPDARWPMFVAAAVNTGICSMTVVPMRVGAARFGALAVYLRRPGGLGPTDAPEANTLASLALDLLLADLGPVTGLVEDRPEIHQATGMVSVQLDIDLPTALLRLRGRAFAENRRLSDLAADVVSRVARFQREHPAASAEGAHDDG